MRLTSCPCKIHLVGSVPLADPEEVFSVIAREIGPYISRIPDGETGARTNWILWQQDVMERTPFLEKVELETQVMGEYGTYRVRKRTAFAPRPEVPRENWHFGPLGYAREAIKSFKELTRLKAEGKIDASVRLQVCLPTPLAPVSSYIVPEAFLDVEAAYEERITVELSEIIAAIGADNVAIQWDTAVEFAILEGVLPSPLQGRFDAIIERLVRLGNLVPEGTELGYHLCYGDSGHKHFKEPEDAAMLVAVTNGITAGLNRRLDWIHLPVPKGRDDLAYYKPLSDLKLPRETELFLGLVHMSDGEDGAQRRMAAASSFVSDYGIATECGFGRRPPETVVPLLQIHASVAGAVGG